MRGKGKLALIHADPDGITPAYAGKRLWQVIAGTACEDHPRLCGEKRPISGITSSKRGSPPPMRGKGQRTLFVNFSIRITPAYAGKS